MAGEMGWVGEFIGGRAGRVWSNTGSGNGEIQGIEPQAYPSCVDATSQTPFVLGRMWQEEMHPRPCTVSV